MSFVSRSLFALCLVSLVASLTGCDSGTEEVATADKETKVEKKKVPEIKRESVGRSFINDSPTPSTGIPTRDERNAEPVSKPLPPKGKDLPESETVVRKIKGFEVALAGGALKFMAPGIWKKGKATSRFVESEITVPKFDGDDKDGRLTIMRAGGSIEQNIERWFGQYAQPDGRETKEVAKVSETSIGDNKVTWVDITGTLLERKGGPMAGGPVVEREGYRMLAAIIQTDEQGQCFVKLYGPQRTIAGNEDAFKGFVESLKINDEAQGL